MSGKGVAAPRWAEPKLLKAGGETIRVQAGVNGSIQGPAEAKWGYTVCSVADWDGDGRLDLIVNGLNADWMRNLGAKDGVTRFADPISLDKRVLSCHTTSPCPCDFDDDGKADLLIGARAGACESDAAGDGSKEDVRCVVQGYLTREFALADGDG